VYFTTAGVNQVEENSLTVTRHIMSHKTRISVATTSVTNPGKSYCIYGQTQTEYVHMAKVGITMHLLRFTYINFLFKCFLLV